MSNCCYAVAVAGARLRRAADWFRVSDAAVARYQNGAHRAAGDARPVGCASDTRSQHQAKAPCVTVVNNCCRTYALAVSN